MYSSRHAVLSEITSGGGATEGCARAFSALRTSPGARHYYEQLRDRGKTHHLALRQVANRLIGIDPGVTP
jgi:hypothetical protein